jgi:hypothetical protein
MQANKNKERWLEPLPKDQMDSLKIKQMKKLKFQIVTSMVTMKQ